MGLLTNVKKRLASIAHRPLKISQSVLQVVGRDIERRDTALARLEARYNVAARRTPHKEK